MILLLLMCYSLNASITSRDVIGFVTIGPVTIRSLSVLYYFKTLLIEIEGPHFSNFLRVTVHSDWKGYLSHLTGL